MQVGARWLSEWCHRAEAGAAYGGSSDDALALAVSRVLLASKSADEAAAELFDLLGDGSFDAIQQILEHRYAFLIAMLYHWDAIKIGYAWPLQSLCMYLPNMEIGM